MLVWDEARRFDEVTSKKARKQENRTARIDDSIQSVGSLVMGQFCIYRLEP